MKITKDYLKRIIKEEMKKVLREQSNSLTYDKLEDYYKTYFDFSRVKKTKTGNKLQFPKELDEIYEMISADDPKGSRRAEWAGNVAKDALNDRIHGIKDPNEAAKVMKGLLEQHRESIENYVNLVNKVAKTKVVSFDFNQVDRAQVKQQARIILSNMIKLLAVGKDYEDLAVGKDYEDYDDDYDDYDY